MRKALLPMLASLALCGAATAALIATNARAEQQVARKPVMIALATQNTMAGKVTAAPPAEAGPPGMPGVASRDAETRRQQICHDLYAGKVGELAFLEAKLSLDAKQAPLFARWKQASLDIAKQHESECAGKAARRADLRGNRPNMVDRMTLEEDLLKRRLADIQAERPALAAFYNALTPAQKAEFSRDGMRGMPGHFHMMLGMMDRPHANMGFMRQGPAGGPPAGPMGEPMRGPMGGPPEPPPPPAQ